MRLLITGSSGFLGNHFIHEYKDNYEIYAPTHQEMDFTKLDEVRTIFRKVRPEIVIHCGAISSMEFCSKNIELSESVNVTGAKNIAIGCREIGARMIFCSSDQVYASNPAQMSEEKLSKAHDETEELLPMPVYGGQKLRAEGLCFMEQPDCVILRLTWMYGIPMDHDLEKHKGTFGEQIKEFMRRKEPMTFSTGVYRGITDCNEVVHNIEKAMKLPAGIYNFGSTSDTNMYETMKRVFQHFGMEEMVQPDDYRENILMDTHKINQYGIHFRSTTEGFIHYIE